ncbi:DNA-binding protein WhiA [Candidatus Mycoplasma mahonii]|uniref:DNA-binding protein WhiA n=1 Tax=Candidatus Mycoplasma mahonii TaxID=3004105 RepID=UPI0026EE8690|nr:DNA-binding protein WhiA [Candidatus Mycoplasma mahonii]WKX02507.1 DNA-binding protein WhiA [Candidatus Mycoplasma mahonii]
MSFALEIKKEILSQEFNEAQAQEFLDGIISTAGFNQMQETIIKINNKDISNVLKDMLGQLYIPYDNTYENRNWIIVEERIPLKENKIKLPGYYFAGAFLGGGSISNIDSTSYHLEIQMYSNLSANIIKNFLNKYNFNFNLIQRRQLWVLYIKKADEISDFLKAIQAFQSMLAFEDSRINRDLLSMVNRYSNLDIYNQKKLVDSYSAFMDDYLYIQKHNMQKNFRDQELSFYELKSKNQYKSLNELIPLYNKKNKINKTRSALNHYLIKLRKKANS